MASQTVSKEAIWDALISDPRFQNSGPEELQQVFRPFVEALPEILEELLSVPVSVQAVMKAKLLFIKYCHAHEFVKKFTEILDFPADELEKYFQSLIEELIPLAGETAATLAKFGVTEEMILSEKMLSIRPEVSKKIKEGMTMGELLVTQPSVIVVNVN